MSAAPPHVESPVSGSLGRRAVPVRLFVFTEHRNATYYINFEFPLAQRVANKTVELHSWSSDELGGCSQKWSEVRDAVEKRISEHAPDAVIFSRYARPFGPELIAMISAHRIPVFFHLDDLLFELPDDLGEKYRVSYDEEYLRALNDCLARSDVILASTDALAGALRERFPEKPIEVLAGVCYLPNLSGRGKFKPGLTRLRQRARNAGHAVIGYMGSNSHARDLAAVSDEIGELMTRHPRLKFQTLGLQPPRNLLSFGPGRVREYGYTSSYREFLQRLYELDWDIGIAPLADGRFNGCKTVTKFVEYTACGIPTLARAIDPYARLAHDERVLAVARPQGWAAAVENWLADTAAARATLERARAFCERAFSAQAAATRLLEAVLGPNAGAPSRRAIRRSA